MSSTSALSAVDGIRESFWKAMGCCTATNRHKDIVAASKAQDDILFPDKKRDVQGLMKKNRPEFPAIFNATSRTLHVPTDYPTISIAIQKANPNDRIIIEPGTYNEGLLIEKSLELIGKGDGDSDVVIRSMGSTALTIEKLEGASDIAVKVRNIMFLVQGGKGNFDHVIDNEGVLCLVTL
jgi:hypothetical protein